MSNVIEKEVVKMEFDNSDFEKKTKESMSTIEKLKQSLNFDKAKDTLKTFAQQANELDFNGLKESVDTVAKRFSNLGIVGMTVVSRLTNSLIDGVTKISRSISGMIVSGGLSRAMKIEEATFKLKGFGMEWDQIKDDIDYGVKDTAYGLDAAANVASQLVASGIQIGDDMKQSLRAISGVAAITGSSYEEIGHIFTTAAGQGKVMTMQLRELEIRGLNAAGKLAEALNTTEANVREMVTKGQIDFATFAKAMDEAFGEHAKDANKTLNGTLDNIRSAWARIGAEFIEPVIRNEGELVGLLNAYREKINQIKEAILPVAKVVTDTINNVLRSATTIVKGIDIKPTIDNASYAITTLLQAFNKLWPRISYFGRQIKNLFREFFPKKEVTDFKDTIDRIAGYIGAFNFNSKTIEKVKDIFRGVFSVISAGIKVFKNLYVVVKPIFKYIASEASKMLDIAAAVGRLLTKLFEGTLAAKDFQRTFESVFESVQDSLDKVKDGFMSLIGVFQDDEKGAKDAFDAIVDIVSGAIETIIILFEDITGLDLSVIKDSFLEFSKEAKYFLRSMYDVYKQAGGGAEGLAAVVIEVMKKIGKKITEFIENTTGIDLGALKTKIESFFNTAREKVTKFLETVKPLESIGKGFTFVKDKVAELADAFTTLATSAAQGLGTMLKNPVGSILGLHGGIAIIDTLRQLARDGALGSIPTTLFDIKKQMSGFLASMNARTIATTAASIVAMGYALKVFASGIAELANVPKFENTIGAFTEMLIAMGGLFLGLKVILGTLKDTNFSGKSVIRPIDQMKATFKLTAGKIVATSILVLAVSKAMKTLTDALVNIASMDANIGQHIAACVEIFGLLVILGEALKKLVNLKPAEGLNGKFFLIYAGTFVLIAEAVKIMSEAFVNLNSEIVKINSIDDLVDSLVAFGVLIGIMASLVYSLNQIKIVNVQNLVALGLGILAISEGVSVLVKAVTILKDVDAENALMGLVVVFSLLWEVMRGAYLLSGSAMSLKTAVGIIAIAGAVAWLAHEIKVLAETPMISIIKGFTTLIGILGTLVVTASMFTTQMPGVKAAGFAMLEFAGSIWIITKAIQNLAKIPIDTISERLGVLLASIVIFAWTLKTFQMDNATAGLALLEIAAGVYILAQAVSVLSSLALTDILKGAVPLVIFMGTLAKIAETMTTAIPGAGAMLILAAAIGVLAVSLRILADAQGSIWGALGVLSALVVVLVIFGATVEVTGPLMMAGAIVIATACGIIAAGLMIVVGVVAIFAASIALIAISAIGAADGLKAFGEVLIEITKNSAGLLKEMSSLSMIMLTATTAMLAGALGLVGLGLGLAAFGAGAAIAAVGAAALAGGLMLLAGALGMLITVLEAANLIEIVNSIGMNSGKQYAESTAKGITDGGDIIKSAIIQLIKNKLLGTIDQEMGINSPSTVMAEKGKYIDMGLAEGIVGNQDLVAQASKQLGTTASTSLSNSISQGTTEGSKTIADAIRQFNETASQGSVSAGQNVGAGFMKGLQAIAPKVRQYAANLGKSAYMAMKQYLKIKSPSRLTMELGQYTGEGFAIGMQNSQAGVEDSAQDLGKTAENSLTTALSAAYDSLTSGIDDPTIKPVLDLSEIQNGASRLDSMFSRDFASNISANYKSNRDYASEESMANASLMTGLNDRLVSALMANDMSDLPINLNVQLVGDAAGVFRLVQSENQRMTNMYGASPLMRG